MGKKIISFSLWGDVDHYNEGAVVNAQIAKTYYPGWTCRFYVHHQAPALGELQKTDGEIIVMPKLDGWSSSMWRFRAAADPDADWIIFRDCDSRLTSKEAAAVAEWVSSGLSMHTMKDTLSHTGTTVMAGMWGIRGRVVPDIETLIREWVSTHEDRYGTDQNFLREIIWPIVKNSAMNHGMDSPAGPGRPFPPYKAIEYGEYVGQFIPAPPRTP